MPPALIGMIHLPALPGTPGHAVPLPRIVEGAREEASVLARAGFGGVIVENMHDRPYVRSHGPEIVAAMTLVAGAVRAAAPGLWLGVQVLSSGWREALAVAHAVGAEFIRVENFVFAHVADEGLMGDAVAGELLRYRRYLGAADVRIFADIKKKHASHAITADVSVAETAAAAELFLADGVIVSGQSTGDPADPGDVAAARGATDLPVLVGSGVTPEQVPSLLRHAHALIVGTWIKRGAVWSNPVDPERAARMADAVRAAGRSV